MKMHFVFMSLVLLFTFAACSEREDVSFVEDRPGILSDQQARNMQQMNRKLLEDVDVHFKLIILDQEADDINSSAVTLFGNLGEETSAARGVLFLVDPGGQQVRIEVGYDLEYIFPDGFVGYLEDKQMVPFFELGKVAEGVSATTELFVARALLYKAGKDYDPDVELGTLEHYSGGGGAQVKVGLNSKQLSKDELSDKAIYSGADSPEVALELYKNVLSQHVKDPNLPLYTPESREFWSNWIVTDAQQDNELKGLKRGEVEKVVVKGGRAVIRYHAENRLNSPYFLERGSQGWMLDFVTMSRVIRMNHKNQWAMVKQDHPYMFAFEDWKFDKNGFPHAGK